MSPRSLADILAAHPFFDGLDPEYVELIAGCARNVRFAADGVVFAEDDPADVFFLLRSGRVAIELGIPSRGPLRLQTVHEGDILGWSWLFPPHRWQFTARAIEPVRALAIDGACLRGKCDEDPRLGYELMKRFARVMVERLRATRVQLLDVYGHPPGGRSPGDA